RSEEPLWTMISPAGMSTITRRIWPRATEAETGWITSAPAVAARSETQRIALFMVSFTTSTGKGSLSTRSNAEQMALSRAQFLRKTKNGQARTRTKTERPLNAAPPNTTPQSRWRYFFLDAFLDDFFAFFLEAIRFTTFHAVRDLPVAPTWHYVPDLSDILFSVLVGVRTREDAD